MIFLEGAKDHYFKGTSQLMHINFWEVATWCVCLLQEISCSHFTGAVGSLRAPRILIGLSGSDQPQVGLPPTFPAQRPGLWALSCVAGHEPSWSRPWPTDCLPGLTSCLPCHCGPAWLSLDLILTLSCRFTSQLGFKPPPSPWYYLLARPGCHLQVCLAHLTWVLCLGTSWQGPCPVIHGVPPQLPCPSGSCWPLLFHNLCHSAFLLNCFKGSLPRGGGSQCAGSVKIPDSPPVEEYWKEVPFRFSFPRCSAGSIVVAVAWQILLVLGNSILFDGGIDQRDLATVVGKEELPSCFLLGKLFQTGITYL